MLKLPLHWKWLLWRVEQEASRVHECGGAAIIGKFPTMKEDPVTKVKVCNICGHAGFDNCLAKCSQCNDGAEHTYCMGTIFDVVPMDWVCEGCTLKQKDTVSKKRSADYEVRLGQAGKKRILSRVLSSPLPSDFCNDAGLFRSSSVKKSSHESKTEQFVSTGMAKGFSKSQVQLGTTFKEASPAYTNQRFDSNAYRPETGTAVFTRKDNCDKHPNTDLPLVSTKTIGTLPTFQSVVRRGVVAQHVRKLPLKVVPATTIKGTSPIAQGEINMIGLESFSKTSEVKLLADERERQELGKPAGFTSAVRENVGQPVNVQRDSAKGVASTGAGKACKTSSSMIADSVIVTVGLESVPSSMLAETAFSNPQVTSFNHIAINSGRHEKDVETRRCTLRYFPTITQKITTISEPSQYIPDTQKEKIAGEVVTPSVPKGLLLLGVGEETDTGQMTKEAVKGMDSSTVSLDMSCENGKGQLTVEDRSMKHIAIRLETKGMTDTGQITKEAVKGMDGSTVSLNMSCENGKEQLTVEDCSIKHIAIGLETKGMDGSTTPFDTSCKIEQGQLTRQGNSVNKDWVEQRTKDSCKMLKATSFDCLTQPFRVGVKVQDEDAMQKGRMASSPSSMIEIPASDHLSKEAWIATYSVSEESPDLSKCARVKDKESSHVVSEPQQELEVHKRTSGAGINRLTRALLKKITRRDFPSPKSHSVKLGKSAVSTCKEGTSIAGQEVTIPQDNMQVNRSSFLSEAEKVTKRDFPTVLPKVPIVPVSSNSVHCTSSTQELPVEGTSVKPSSTAQKDIEAASKILQAKEKVCQTSKEESPLLHQTRPADTKHDCDKKQESNARISVSCASEEAPRKNASNVTIIEPVSIMTTTTALHTKGASDQKIVEEPSNSAPPIDSELVNDTAATFERTEAFSNQSGPIAGDTLKNASIVQAAMSKGLSLTNTRLLNSSSTGENVEGPIQHNLLKQKGVLRGAAMPLSGRVERTSSHVSVSGKTMTDVLKAQSNKEALACKSIDFGQADQNHVNKDFSSNVNPLPADKRASRVHCAVSRSVPMATGDDQAINCVPEGKDHSKKKVHFCVNGVDDFNRDSGQLGFHAKHRDESCELSDCMEKPSSLSSKHPSLAVTQGSNLDVMAMKCDHRAEVSRCQICETGSYKGAGRCDKCKAGYSTEFLKDKNDRQREWRESYSLDFLERGSTERSLNSGHTNGPFCDSAFYKGAYRCGRCGEAGHSTEFCRMDKQRVWERRDSLDLNDKVKGLRDPNNKPREWRMKESPDYYGMHREWKWRDSLDANAEQREWRRKDPPDENDKLREWRRKDSTDLMHKQKQWKSGESLDLLEKRNDWRRKDAPNPFEKERDWRRKDPSNFVEKQWRHWRQNNSLDFVVGDVPGNRSNARHAKRSFPGFQVSDEGERGKYGPRQEKALNSRSCLELKHADSVRVCSKRSIQEHDCTQRDKGPTLQWQSKEQRGCKRERLDLSKATELDTEPVSEPSEYTSVHQRQIVRVQAEDTRMSSQLHGPARNCFVQDRRALPSSEVLWIGCFDVVAENRWSTIYKGIQAHPSTVADPKVFEALLALPYELQMEEIKRGEGNDSWPRTFQQCPPTSESIGIFFAPKDMESDNAWYQALVHRLNARGLVLKSEMDFVQLLVYPSQLLPEAEQRWDGRFFLWGIFRRSKSGRTIVDPRQSSERDHGSDRGSPEGNGEPPFASWFPTTSAAPSLKLKKGLYSQENSRVSSHGYELSNSASSRS
ncbi:hypothetical protein GOP47_0012440 [Adiantum capillus-veneris]|uniref:AIPP2-like SPOC-like domain-containing protein n=1 Tax=Adiantum capillus-veneris TaxID=13818 RepID=A0A9D4UQN9_ADICA|nr:hypothetical protein GOP47_0012440 [Adiantum capillus-veneris]